MLPAEALRRIAFLLEAEGARSYKPEAFRRAAATVDALGIDRLEELWRQGRLKELPSVGATTSDVIAQALAGSRPAYLVALEERAPASTGAVLDLSRTLRGDCHSHSNWSDGGTTIEEMAEAAAAMGHEYLALTDHSPRLTVAHGLSADQLRRQVDVVAALNERLTPFRLLTGIEVDILDDGSLDQDELLLSQLDVVVASVHSKLRMEPAGMTRRMLGAVRNRHVDVLGHCTGRVVVGRGRPPSTFDHEAVFAACAEHAVAVEVNSRPDRLDPPDDLLAGALAAGCRLAIDSDAHAPGQLSWLRFGCEKAVAVGAPPEAIVNAMPLARFLAWAARDR